MGNEARQGSDYNNASFPVCFCPVDKEYKWRMLRLKKQHQIRSSQEEVLKRINFSSTTVEKTMPVPKQVIQIIS